jgi:hypothetical protein
MTLLGSAQVSASARRVSTAGKGVVDVDPVGVSSVMITTLRSEVPCGQGHFDTETLGQSAPVMMGS